MHIYTCTPSLSLSPPAVQVLSRCPLSSSSQQQLARKTVLGSPGNSGHGNGLLGYLKSEVHVGTACVGVGVLVRWCEVIGEGEEVPSMLLDHIKVHVYMLMRDAEGRSKEARSYKQQGEQHSTPKAVTFPRKMSCLGWDSNP